MKNIFKLMILLLLVLMSNQHVLAFSDEFSGEEVTEDQRQENLVRTQKIVDQIKKYMQDNDAYVGVIARRGAGNAETGVSDTDTLDLTGMAHTGFIIKNGFSKEAEYITFNLVRQKGAKTIDSKDYDLSELKIWSLPHFFIGTFEKDAIVFLPEKKVQLKLWNLLRANGTLDIEERKRSIKDDKGNQRLDDQGAPVYATDLIIKNGAFPILHNPEYNLLSDYVETSTQNCNEHVLKTYIGLRDFWQSGKEGYELNDMTMQAKNELDEKVVKSVETQYTPGEMILSRTKSTFAFVQNIRFGERFKKAPSLFGIKFKPEKFDIVSVDSFCDPKNQSYLNWSDFKVFREKHTEKQGWFIENWNKQYVKENRLTGKKNAIELM